MEDSNVLIDNVQLIWKFVASEEDYNSQLTVLVEHYKTNLEMAAVSRKPPLSLGQSNSLFRNRYYNTVYT